MAEELKDAKEKIEKEYTCNWPGCGYIFKIKVGKRTSTKGAKGNISVQVKCPKCKNYLKTW